MHSKIIQNCTFSSELLQNDNLQSVRIFLWPLFSADSSAKHACTSFPHRSQVLTLSLHIPQRCSCNLTFHELKWSTIFSMGLCHAYAALNITWASVTTCLDIWVSWNTSLASLTTSHKHWDPHRECTVYGCTQEAFINGANSYRSRATL